MSVADGNDGVMGDKFPQERRRSKRGSKGGNIHGY
jgi:hypothetical protein